MMSVMMMGMATTGKVRVWHDEDGWGVIDSASTPGGCWVHFSNVAVPGFSRLEAGQLVELEWEPLQQDGYSYRAVRAWPQGQQPYDRPAETATTSAYHSTLTRPVDEPPAT